MILFLIILVIVALSAKKVVEIVNPPIPVSSKVPKIQPEIGELGIPFREQIKEYLINQEKPNYLQNNLFTGTAKI